MNLAVANVSRRISRQAFTLVELAVASTISIVIGGTVVLLVFQSATEQRKGYADTAVEQEAYTLEANITSCLRSMSANQGATPNYATQVSDSSGNPLGYQSIVIFYPTNGGYITGSINYIPATGQVIYTPNVLTPTTQIVWMTNSTTTLLTNLLFSTSFNPDGSQNSSLVNVQFQMNDNGYSKQNPTNNPASLYRSFAVQMRNDN